MYVPACLPDTLPATDGCSSSTLLYMLCSVPAHRIHSEEALGRVSQSAFWSRVEWSGVEWSGYIEQSRAEQSRGADGGVWPCVQ